MADKNPNQIDINLSLMSGTTGAHFEQFVKELSTVSKQLSKISRMSFPEAGGQMAMNVEGGGKSSGTGPLQERQAAKQNENYGSKGSSSGEVAGERVQRNLWSSLGRAGKYARRALGTYDDPMFRESHPNDHDFVGGVGPSGHGGSGGRGGRGGGHGGGGGPSRGGGGDDENLTPGERDLLRLRGWAADQVELPRFGALTVQDKLGYMRNIFSKMAIDENTGEVTNPQLQKWAGRFDKAHSLYPYLETAARGGSWLRNQTYGRAQGMQTYGTNLGYQRTAPDFHFGPFGFQIPFTQMLTKAGRVSLNDTVHKAYISAQAGINHDQVNGIYENLQSRGYVDGSARDKMLDSLVQLTKRNPGMDTKQLGAMQDEATRFGGESLQAFNDQMNKLPDIAHAANVSLGETMSHLDELGKTFTTEFGGTYSQGTSFGAAFMSATGMPAPIGGKLLQNPFVQSQIMSQTGMLPQQMGNAGNSTLIGASLRAVQQMMGMYKGFKGRDWTDKFGATHHVDGSRQAEAMVAAQMGIPVDRVHALLAKGSSMEINSEVMDLTSGRDHYIKHILGRKDLSQQQKDAAITSAMKDHNYQAMWKAMRAKGTSFTHDERVAIEKAGELHGHWAQTGGGRGGPGRAWVADDAMAAEKRQSDLIRKTLHQHEQKLSDRAQGTKEHVTIDLTKEAKVLLKVVGGAASSGPGSVIKSIANAGGAPLNAVAHVAGDLLHPVNAINDVAGAIGDIL